MFKCFEREGRGMGVFFPAPMTGVLLVDDTFDRTYCTLLNIP